MIPRRVPNRPVPEISAKAKLTLVRKGRQKPPLENTSAEAVALRTAAIEFARRLSWPVSDDIDTRGQRLNRDLLDAAIAYAMRVLPTGSEADRRSLTNRSASFLEGNTASATNEHASVGATHHASPMSSSSTSTEP